MFKSNPQIALKEMNPSIDFNQMEGILAREMASINQDEVRKMIELRKLAMESQEIKGLKMQIEQALLNKQRAAQIAENQYRNQVNLENDTSIEVEMLRQKERADLEARRAEHQKNLARLEAKAQLQQQMIEREQLRDRAFEEYAKEKVGVDQVVGRMIAEDHESLRLQRQKQEQSKQDMILSVAEKQALLKRQRELEEYENEMVRRYNASQNARAADLQAMKMAAEEQREEIFKKLAEEEAQRRAEAEYVEALRNDLQVQLAEQLAREKEQEDAERRVRQRTELQAAKEYQVKLKLERLAEEKQLEDEFKGKMALKFAEDERIEQLNAAKRRMKEQEHKREIEKLWGDKLALYREQRDQEWQERQKAAEEQAVYDEAVAAYKEQLLQENAALLAEFNPKAASQYQVGIQGAGGAR